MNSEDLGQKGPQGPPSQNSDSENEGEQSDFEALEFSKWV